MARIDTGYTRAERLSDATIHILGVAMGAIGVLALIGLTVWRGAQPTIIGATTIYCLTLLAMLCASAVYHMAPWDQRRAMLQNLDRSAIYLKIAGTYTPFAILSGEAIPLLLPLLWGAAILGMTLRIFWPDRFEMPGLLLYLFMGWSGVLTGGGVVSGLGSPAVILMVMGGLVYTLGVVFFLWENLPFHKTIWHAMVLFGTCLMYAALVTEVSSRTFVPL